jgi:hypothetical protein
MLSERLDVQDKLLVTIDGRVKETNGRVKGLELREALEKARREERAAILEAVRKERADELDERRKERAITLQTDAVTLQHYSVFRGWMRPAAAAAGSSLVVGIALKLLL